MYSLLDINCQTQLLLQPQYRVIYTVLQLQDLLPIAIKMGTVALVRMTSWRARYATISLA